MQGLKPLKTQSPRTPTRKRIGNLNSPTSMKDIKAIINKLQKQKADTDMFTYELMNI